MRLPRLHLLMLSGELRVHISALIYSTGDGVLWLAGRPTARGTSLIAEVKRAALAETDRIEKANREAQARAITGQ